MLSDQIKEYLKTEDKDNKWNRNVQAVYNYRIRQQLKKAIEDLTFIAEELPEKEFNKVFTVEEMERFFRALFKIEINAKSHDEWLQAKNSKQIRLKRKRLLELSKAVLTAVANQALIILPESLRPFIASDAAEPESLTKNLKCLLYAQVEEL